MRWQWPWVRRSALDKLAAETTEAINLTLQDVEETKAELTATASRELTQLRNRLEQDARRELTKKLQLITECEIALRQGHATRWMPTEASGGVWSPIVSTLSRRSLMEQQERGGWISAQIFITPHLLMSMREAGWLSEILGAEIADKIHQALTGAAAYEHGARGHRP